PPGSSANDALTEVFPHFLVPRGLASLWGLQPLVPTAAEPWLSLWVALGAALLGCAAVACLAMALRAVLVGLLGGVCLLVGSMMARQMAAFGLFKLAMIIQPFLLGALAPARCPP